MKAYWPACSLTRAGGTVIGVAPCEEGILGTFYVNQGMYDLNLNRVCRPGVSVLLASDMEPDEVRKSVFEPIADVESALRRALDRSGPKAEILIMPEGAWIVPDDVPS